LHQRKPELAGRRPIAKAQKGHMPPLIDRQPFGWAIDDPMAGHGLAERSAGPSAEPAAPARR
jgi:hypothetical protein